MTTTAPLTEATFTSTTFSTNRDFAVAVLAGSVDVVTVVPAGEKLFDVSYTCATDTYAEAVHVIRVNRTTAQRVGQVGA